MRLEIRERLRKQRGTPIYVYSSENFTLLYVFESKQPSRRRRLREGCCAQMYNLINIHHTTLNDCLNLGTLYVDAFFFSPLRDGFN
jgi:hypothetical protein